MFKQQEHHQFLMYLITIIIMDQQGQYVYKNTDQQGQHVYKTTFPGEKNG